MGPGQDNSNQSPVDRAMLEELKEVLEDDYALLLQTFLKDANKRIKLLGDAVLQDAVDTVRAQAHSFKGSASNIGAGQLSRLCQRLENMGREGDLEGAAPVFEELAQEFSRVVTEIQKDL